MKEWHDKKTGFWARFPFGPFALKRIDKTIQDPVWEAAKLSHSNDDPTEQLPNQPHIEFWTTELYFPAPPAQNDGQSTLSLFVFLSNQHYLWTFLGNKQQSYDPVKGEGIITLITFLCRAKQRGTVRLSSNVPTSKPLIDHGHLSEELDVAVLAEGCRLGHEVLMKGSGTKDIICGPWPNTISHPEDTAGWKEHVRTSSGTCFHPGGTCKMAPDDDPMGVVDSRLRVRNIANLRVADVSILPILNSGHTQAPAYAIGEKAAHMVLQDAVDG